MKFNSKDLSGVVLDNHNKHLITLHNWYIHRTGYVRVNLWEGKKCSTLQLHHLVLPKKEGYDIDHINNNPLDNRENNLRYSTKAQNQRNRGPQKNNTTGYKGVGRTSDGKFCARLTHNKKKIWLGTYVTAEEAYKAYTDAAERLQGDFRWKK